MPLDFFVATDDEVANLNVLENLVELICRYEISACGANNIQDFKLLSEFFLQYEENVQKEFIKTLKGNLFDENYTFDIYKLERKFIENVAQIDKEMLDNEDSVKFWQSRGYFEQGIWNCVYGVHNLCNYAVRDSKNLYLVSNWTDLS